MNRKYDNKKNEKYKLKNGKNHKMYDILIYDNDRLKSVCRLAKRLNLFRYVFVFCAILYGREKEKNNQQHFLFIG